MHKPLPQQPARGQESVWDYPRPPRAEPTGRKIRIEFNGIVLAETTDAIRMLETSHPPVYYIPQKDIRMEYLTATRRQSFCEFKGQARYWTVQVGDRTETDAAWSYPNPTGAYAAIQDYVAFYPSRMDACFVDEERVQPQEGDFYGGWITKDIVGPFKGGFGTWGW